MNTQLVSLTAKASKSEGRLQVHYTIHNGEKTPILVFNRLQAGGHPRAVDAQQIYRFVSGEMLNLLLGPAPLPGNALVTFKNIPDVTRVEPYTSLHGEVSAALPVSEYSPYFDVAGPDNSIAARVQTVKVFANYIDATGIELVPSTIHPGAFTALRPSSNPEHTIRSGPIALTLDVLLQKGDFSRFEPH